MPRTPKAPKTSAKAGRGEEKADPVEALQAALQAARWDLMRAQRDLESVRLELVEQKRKSSQHALVHAEELKEARATREQLRMQLDALRGEQAAPAKKRRREDDGRVADLEQELDEARTALAQARRELAARHVSPPPAASFTPPPAPARLDADVVAPPRAETPSPHVAGAIARAEPDSVPVAPAVPDSGPPQAPVQRSFLSKIFGRRSPA